MKVLDHSFEAKLNAYQPVSFILYK